MPYCNVRTNGTLLANVVGKAKKREETKNSRLTVVHAVNIVVDLFPEQTARAKKKSTEERREGVRRTQY